MPDRAVPARPRPRLDAPRPARPRTLLLSVPVCLLLLAAGVDAQDTTGVPYTVQQEVYSAAPTRDGDMKLVMDIYRPRGRPAEGAVILMHGGGFTGGSREIEENRVYGRALASRGYLAAAISYRLLGDAPVVRGWAKEYSRKVARIGNPRLAAALEERGPGFTDAVAAAGVDLAAAVRWLRRHAPGLRFDPDDIALFGASAGAISALTVTYAMELYGAAPPDVACVIALRGLLLRPGSVENPFDEGDPPLMILHGEEDRRALLSDAEEVFRLAREAGAPVELYTAPEFGHELGGAALLGLRVDRRSAVLDRLDAFLEAAFAGEVAARSLRRRLHPPGGSSRSSGDGSPPTPGGHPDDSRFRAELRSAVRALVRSVREGRGFLDTLYRFSRTEMLEHELSDPARRDWSYWPRERAGLPLRHMSAAQRIRTHRVLSTLLSSRGYLQVNHVMMLEEVLAGRETSGFARGAGEYTIAVFGRPSPEESWGLRFEGHHLSLNITLSPGGVSVTPSFLGASPAPITEGVRAGFDPLVHEQRRALDLLESLDERQRAAAVLADEPLPDVVTTQFRVDPAEWDRWRSRLTGDGVSASTFDGGQKSLLRELLAEIVGLYREGVGRVWLDTVDLNGLTFAWMGEAEIGRPHYFRIQGERFVFELDAAQEGGAHVHTVWRDRTGDFGGEPLRRHNREHAH